MPRPTIDVDGTVVCTGAQVQWAFRGFNPHHRKHLSYYPLLAHIAQTGHILRLKNRPDNAHDSKQAVAFVREMIDSVRAGLPARRARQRLRDQSRSFQLDTGAEPKRRSRKRTYAFLFRSMRTLRFLARAGRVVRIGGRTRLRLAQNPGVQQLYERLDGTASL